MSSLPNVPGVDNEPRGEGAGGVDAFWGLLIPVNRGVVEMGEVEDEGGLPELLCSPPVSHLPKAC